ncbi:hypothetical protein YPPY72_4605, partial [Yersinia pestis PY-72]
MAPDNGWG